MGFREGQSPQGLSVLDEYLHGTGLGIASDQRSDILPVQRRSLLCRVNLPAGRLCAE